jgi:predicted porin
MAPSGTSGVAVRASNTIGYFLPPNLGGFYGQAQYWMGENDDTTGIEDDGSGFGLRIGYGQGPFNVALGWARTNYDAAGLDDFTTWNLGGQWDFGMAKLMAQYGRDEGAAGGASVEGRGWLIGALVPVGAGEVRASYSEYRWDFGAAGEPRARKFAVGYVHNLSKRTAVYATIARARNSDGFVGAPRVALGASTFGAGTINGSSTGYDIGIRHSF